MDNYLTGEELAEVVLTNRKLLGLSQGQLGKIVGLNQLTICSVECHPNYSRTASTLDKLNKGLNGIEKETHERYKYAWVDAFYLLKDINKEAYEFFHAHVPPEYQISFVEAIFKSDTEDVDDK